MVVTYSKRLQGSVKLSQNFSVREFACKNGTDTVLIDTALVDILQKIRDHFNATVTISSAYRTPAYNKQVGGSSGQLHTKGMAADIIVAGHNAVEVAMYAQTICSGCGAYFYGTSNFVHVDTRTSVCYWLCASKGVYEYHKYANAFMPTIKKGLNLGKKSAVKFLQKRLGLGIDGSFGAGTYAAVVNFQRSHDLVADGIVGNKTWAVMF